MKNEEARMQKLEFRMPSIRMVFSFSFSILHSTFPAGRAFSAVVAQQLYTLLVGGSNPSAPTISEQDGFSTLRTSRHLPFAPSPE